MKTSSKSPKSPKSVLLYLSWYSHDVHKGVATFAAQARWALDATPCFNRQIPKGWHGDGIISQFDHEATEPARFILNVSVPVVHLSQVNVSPKFYQVCQDDFKIGDEIAKEFLSKGFKHCAFFTFGAGSQVVDQRLLGYKTTVEKAGKNFYLIDLTKEFSINGKTDACLKMLGERLQKLPKPLAVGAQYDHDAELVAKACVMKGLHIPDDVSIIGVDNNPINSNFSLVPLTSLDLNYEIFGYQGAKLLHDLMNGRRPKQRKLLMPSGEIIRRRSTERLATSDPIVTSALEFILNNYKKDITVSDIVDHCGVSRSALFRRYETELGSSPKQELLRLRVEEAKRMLSGTAEKIENIAERCGFNTLIAFSKTFTKQTGYPPSFFRSQDVGVRS